MKELNMKLTGKIIKELREQANESQEQLANALNAPNRETITRWENGSRDLKREHIIAIAQHFNVSSDYLLGLSETPSTDEDIQIISNATGLCDMAIANLKLTKENLLNISNVFISDKIFVTIIQRLYDYIEQCAKVRYYENIQAKIDEYFDIENINNKDLKKKSDFIEALGIVLRCVGCGTAKKYRRDGENNQRDLVEYRLFKETFKIIDSFRHNTNFDDLFLNNLKHDSATQLSNAIKYQKEKGNEKVANILNNFQKRYKMYPLYYYEEMSIKEYEKITGKKYLDSVNPKSVIIIKKKTSNDTQHNPKEE